MPKINRSARVAETPEEPAFLVPIRDWTRFRKRLIDMARPEEFAGNLGWACVGVGGGTVVTTVLWAANWMEMSAATQTRYAWVNVALTLVVIGCVVVGWLGFWFDSRIPKVRKQTIEHVVEDIDSIAAPYVDAQTAARPAAAKSSSETEARP